MYQFLEKEKEKEMDFFYLKEIYQCTVHMFTST
jgi:hypothetical protein